MCFINWQYAGFYFPQKMIRERKSFCLICCCSYSAFAGGLIWCNAWGNPLKEFCGSTHKNSSVCLKKHLQRDSTRKWYQVTLRPAAWVMLSLLAKIIWWFVSKCDFFIQTNWPLDRFCSFKTCTDAGLFKNTDLEFKFFQRTQLLQKTLHMEVKKYV